nr:hypothetical protein [Kibdelosporangium sp. MJ126-NF4]CTQ90232.1 hypothetical protein [Kibdelosporangium sp. MJ126-NF4]
MYDRTPVDPQWTRREWREVDTPKPLTAGTGIPCSHSGEWGRTRDQSRAGCRIIGA